MDLINKNIAEGKFDVYEKKEPVKYEKSSKIPDFATITINGEDHTLGNIVRQQLLRDKRVRFAGYRKPHPLYDLVEFKVQSNGEVEPWKLLEDACMNLTHHLDAVDLAFEQALVDYENQTKFQYGFSSS